MSVLRDTARPSILSSMYHLLRPLRGRIPKHAVAESPIKSLNPASLKPSDYLDLSSRPKFIISHASAKRDERTNYLWYHPSTGPSVIPFPPNTAGFLYYNKLKDRPYLSGTLRFRCTTAPGQACSSTTMARIFAAGTDLLDADGLPWSVPLVALLKFSDVRRLLLDDGLVTRPQLAHCQSLDGVAATMRQAPRTSLYEFGQPFVTEFARAHWFTVFLPRGEVAKFVMRGPFEEQRGKTGTLRPSVYAPYQGRALAQFELSKHPKHTTNGRRFAVVRILKLIKPPSLKDPTYDGYLPPPVEGELVIRRRQNTRTGPDSAAHPMKVWALNLDAGRGKVLGRLLDATGENPTPA